ncbi:MAG: hypothetical protein A3C42_05570, partial [Chlamydiae bacterium RIFCSPHIGHO2_02_FULL_45_9]
MGKDVVLVTGSCGRIGTAVVKRLGEAYKVVGFELLKAIYASRQAELIPIDLSSDESVHQAFMHVRNVYGKKIASVIHLAAYYSFATKESPLYEKITVKGTEKLLYALQDFDVEQFLFTSTMLVHKPTEPGYPITEESELCGSWGYPRSKIETEALIHEQRGKIPAVFLRIAGVYDDGCHSIPISHQIQRIYEKQWTAHLMAGDISHGAAFVHMDDVVTAMALAVEKRRELPPETRLLIGEPKTLSYDEMQRVISFLLYQKEMKTLSVPKWFAKTGAWLQCLAAWKHKPFIRPWMIDFADDHFELNIDQAKKVLGWEPKQKIARTLPIMIA